MIRGLGLRGAVAVNIITMVGIGPLVTIPLVLTSLHGSLALLGWVVGALLGLCDGLVWAELGSRFPGSGGTYVFLREAFGRKGAGHFLSFLFVWQFVLSAPLLLASGYIGFAQYAKYLWPGLGGAVAIAGIAVPLQGVAAAVVAAVTIALLYRSIVAVGRLSAVLCAITVGTLLAVIAASATHFNAAQAFSTDHTGGFGLGLLAGLGSALVIALYDYAGYGDVCMVGDEVVAPSRTIPRAVVISIAIVAVLYVALQIGVLGVVPWQQLIATTPGGSPPDSAQYVASTVVERTWGAWPAHAVTIAILVTAFASTFGNLLGFSRIPYAAALDGTFFSPFARLHATGRFPNVSLVVIGALAIPASFLTLDQAIAALTTGLVLVQSVAQVVATFVLRARGETTPFRMWLFPLPALLAAVGWVFIFFSAGTAAIEFGVLTVLAGATVYFVRARVRREWPFAVSAALAIGLFLAAAPRADAAQWGSSAIVQQGGYPVFEVDGKPFFVYGGAFFYERMPPSRWEASLQSYRDLGINTLDLYVPWNWHELADGDFDFTGRTSPRRDLHRVMDLARKDGFKIILRPGPVIRNEWRNGGYPAWLLKRPEYGMPQHDLLEGRYPPTATLQNAHSDDAAAEWMRNATHVRYAKRWLERVLHEFEPVADLVVAVQLDDDQGAYIDNQTWPAPNLQAYLEWLRGVVHGVTGPNVPVFINTYQMKVTASSPVWAWGNWYQSDAYAIGEHDRTQLEFSTGLLQTQPGLPLMVSEFQAGWLLQPGDVLPRAADPTNTGLALATMVAMGAHGIVNFPVQDTLNPDGMEAPFANWFYDWDAALRFTPVSETARAADVAKLGGMVKFFGPMLATAHVVADAAIAYTTSAFDPAALTNAGIASIATATQTAQRACRNIGLTCMLVDLRYAPNAELARYPFLIVPDPTMPGGNLPILPAISAKLSRYIAGHRALLAVGDSQLPGLPPQTWTAQTLASGVANRALAWAGTRRSLVNLPNATLLSSNSDAAFLAIVNYESTKRAYKHGVVRRPGRPDLVLPDFVVNGRETRYIALSAPLTEMVMRPSPSASPEVDQPCRAMLPLRIGVDYCLDNIRPSTTAQARRGDAIAYDADLFESGSRQVVLESGSVRLVVSPEAGARSFFFQSGDHGANAFTTVGAMRDDVTIQQPPSATDRIAKYTHQFPAGMFNRPYQYQILKSGPEARVRFWYDAPDVVPAGARFERTVTLQPPARQSFSVDERVTFSGDSPMAKAQRAVSISSLVVGDPHDMTTQVTLTPAPRPFTAQQTLEVTTGNALGFWDRRTHDLATIAWRAGGVESASLEQRTDSVVARLTLAPNVTAHIVYGLTEASSEEAAEEALAEADAHARSGD